MPKIHFYAPFFCLFFLTACHAQVKPNPSKGELSAQTITTGGQPKLMKTQGSSQADNVHCGLQDKAGNLWFGTTGEGVYRYDGKTFTQFTVKDGLNSNTVWDILEDKNGNIWIGTNAGLCRYDGKTITRIALTTDGNLFANAVTKNEVFSMMQTKNGVLWFGTTEGIYCYNGTVFTRFLDNKNIVNPNGLTLKSVQCMLEDKDGNVWFGSGPMAFEGIGYYDNKTLTNLKPFNENWIRHFVEAKNGSLWLGTRHNGICRYDGKGFTKFVIGDAPPSQLGDNMLMAAPDKTVAVLDNDGLSIFADKAGNLWMGGGIEKDNGFENDGGIYCYDGKTFKNFNAKDGLGNYSIFFIMEDKKDNIWVGTRNTGLYRYDGKTFTSFTE